MKRFFIIALILCTVNFSVISQQSLWKTDGKGWVLRKAPGSNEYKRFFAIGLWNAPGHTLVSMDTPGDEYRNTLLDYLNQTDAYNMAYTNPGGVKDKQNRVEIAGSIPFYNTLRAYQQTIPGLLDNIYWQYNARRFMRDNPNDPRFVEAFNHVIDSIIKKHGEVDHIWAPIDEIVQGGAGADWTYYPQTGAKIKELIKKKEPNTLIYTDLVGLSRGCYYLFEKNYLRNHSALPDGEPPFEALGPDAKVYKGRETLGFSQAYDGKPVYVNGTLDYTEYDEPTMKDIFYNNLKLISKDYKICGDVFGINSFTDCNVYPSLAGVAIDGLRAGLGEDAPIWIFYDGNGYAQPSDENAQQFVQNLKCQMYTSIIHGATGVMFWNDRTKPVEVFDRLEDVVREMENNIPIFTMETEFFKVDKDLHYMIKKEGAKRYLMASNTSKTSPVSLSYHNVNTTLKPLEVLILEL